MGETGVQRAPIQVGPAAIDAAADSFAANTGASRAVPPTCGSVCTQSSWKEKGAPVASLIRRRQLANGGDHFD